MYYLLKLGELYIDRISIDDYDIDINIGFTATVDDAKKFNELNYLAFKNLIEMLLNCELTIIFVDKQYDKKFIINKKEV